MSWYNKVKNGVPIMKITRSNYEAYFLDFIDGTLSMDMIDDFLDFLKKNPDLEEEIKLVSKMKLTPEPSVFEGKGHLLKKEVSFSEEFDYRSVALIEGDMPQEEKEVFLQELQQDPVKQRSFLLMKKVRLTSDPSITFPGKQKNLKKENNKRKLVTWLSGAAAIIILAITVLAIYSSHEQSEPQILSPREIVDSGEKPDASPIIESNRQDAANKELPALASVVEAKVKTEQIKDRLHQPEKLQPSIVRENDLPDPIKPLNSSVKLSERDNFNKEKLEKPPKQVAPSRKPEPLTLGTIAKVSLLAAENISNERLNVETNSRGQIAEISLNTRLIGFSIPFRKKK